MAAASVIHQNPAHHLRRSPEEMSPIAPVGVPLINQPQVYLVHQCRWLKRVTHLFATQLVCCYPPQFRVDERQQFVEGVRVSTPPLRQQSSQIGSRGHLRMSNPSPSMVHSDRFLRDL
jgi:hypothetical protein